MTTEKEATINQETHQQTQLALHRSFVICVHLYGDKISALRRPVGALSPSISATIN